MDEEAIRVLSLLPKFIPGKQDGKVVDVPFYLPIAFQKSLKEDPSNILSEFYILRTKDEFYGDIDSKIAMYEQYVAKHAKSRFLAFAEKRIKALKEEKFLQED